MTDVFHSGCFVQDFLCLLMGIGIGAFCTSFLILPRMMLEESFK